MSTEGQRDDPDNLILAEQKYEAAKQVLGSTLLSADRINQIAYEYALEAFRLNPKSIDHFVFLWRQIERTNRSLFDAGLDEEISITVSIEPIRELIAQMVYQVIMKLIVEHVENHASPYENTRDAVLLMEKIYAIDPSPKNAHCLGHCYIYSGRLNEALPCLSYAAEKNTNYAFRYLMLCFSEKKYEDIIEYYEKYNPPCGEVLHALIAQAYEQRMLGNKWNRSPNTPAEEDKRRLEAMMKALELHRMVGASNESSIRDPERVKRCIDCGAFLYLAAGVLDSVNPENIKALNIQITSFDMRKDGLAILRSIVRKIMPETIDDRFKHLVLMAEMHSLACVAYIDMPVEKMQGLISDGTYLAQCLDNNPQFALNHTMYYSLAILCERVYEETKDEKFLELYKTFFGKTLIQFWDNPKIYHAIMEACDNQDDFSGKYGINALRELAHMLDRLIKCDLYNRGELGGKFGFMPGQPRFDSRETFENDFESLADEAISASLPINEYFAPMRKALEPTLETYSNFLRCIAPTEAVISHRIKTPHSFLLKLLKLNTTDFSQVTDCVGFTVLTDTVPEAIHVYLLVKADMDQTKGLDEWVTLCNPTPTGFRSMNILGHSKTANKRIEVQVRTKTIDQTINTTAAHHDHYKMISGQSLKDQIDQDPMHYLHLMDTIVWNLQEAHKKVMETETKNPIAPADVLNIYGLIK